MRRTRDLILTASLLLLFLQLSTHLARAAGAITGLAASPSPAKVGAQVTVTVQGTGSCNELRVDFGDGSPPVPLISADFTKGTNVTAPPHAYAAAKTYSLKATPIKGCTGSASASLAVQSPGGPGTGTGASAMKPGAPKVGGLIDPAKLCVLTGACVPAITAKLGLVTPGSTVLLLGSGFGGGAGKAILEGKFGTREMKIVEWYPKGIACRVPDDIEGVPDHTVNVMVQTQGGAKSGAFPLDFHPLKEVKLLLASDVPTLACAATSQINSCNWTVKVSGGGVATNEPWTGCVYKRSVCGWHENGLGLGGLSAGTDSYEIKLANGWLLYDKSSLSSGSLYSAHLADEPGGFVAGSSSWKFSIKWWSNKYAWTTYAMDVFAMGPKGVPLK